MSQPLHPPPPSRGEHSARRPRDLGNRADRSRGISARLPSLAIVREQLIDTPAWCPGERAPYIELVRKQGPCADEDPPHPPRDAYLFLLGLGKPDQSLAGLMDRGHRH